MSPLCKEAIILAGGLGTRLRAILPDLPKPMADINGRPFLSYLIDFLADKGMERILLSVGYKYEVILNYFGRHYGHIELEYVIEDRPLGTGGAIRESMKKVMGEDAVVLNGDTFFQIDLDRLLAFHAEKRSLLTLAVKPMHDFDRYGTVIVNEDRVTGFEEKSFRSFGYINGGIYVINKGISEYFQRFEGNFSFETDFLQNCPGEVDVFAYCDKGYFIDIGIPEEYGRAQRELAVLFGKGHQK
ncbi:MAG: nucleotidyltransferase family protein [Nitrospirae bacterium]|nr:nucleotidyltransferase family protein [Nitrospirota bacterium]